MTNSDNSGILQNPSGINRRAMLALGLVCLLSGYKTEASAAGFGPTPVMPGWKTLVLRAENNANAGSPFAFDIVFVRDATVLLTVAAMSASKWFAHREDLKRSNSEALTVLSFELVPGQTVKVPEELWRGVAGRGVLAFAGYASQGGHRISLAPDTGGYLIQFDAKDFSATGLKK